MVDVTSDLELFSTALRSLVPILERSGINWRNEGQYDEFYDIADGLFKGLVISKFADDERYSSRFEPYVYAMSKPNVVKFVAEESKTGRRIGEFKRFISDALPFDSIEIESDDVVVSREFSTDEIRIFTE